MYQARFSARRYNGVPNFWVECESVRLESNLGFAFTRDLCRALRAAGHPDGAIEFVSEDDLQLVYRFASIFAVAEGRTPMPRDQPPKARPILSDIMYNALVQIAADPMAHWQKLHGHTRRALLDRGFVTADAEMQPHLTDLAINAIDHYEDGLIYPNIATAEPKQLEWAATVIGLQNAVGLRRTLRLIETTIDRPLAELVAKAQSMGISVPAFGNHETMRKRRLIAGVINAGKLPLFL